MAIISLRKVDLAFGHHKLLDHIDLDIEHNKRICLIGRNGAGKSSLLKLLQGELTPDNGERIVHGNASVAWLPQEVPTQQSGNILEVTLSGLGSIGQKLNAYNRLLQQDLSDPKMLSELANIQKQIDDQNAWQYQNDAEKVLSQLSLEGSALFAELSGGLKRRALLAKALVTQPDILFLDEPTNHLDIASISFLESFLLQYTKTIVFITHDRNFLQSLATDIIELDRGKILNFPGNYEQFIKQKEDFLEAQAKQNALFDKKLEQEESWIRQGIKARRTRNEGRVRALMRMRQERQERHNLQGRVSISSSQSSQRSSKVVIKAQNITFDYQNKSMFSNFSCQLHRNDKIAILGPNGCGKTTLLKILLKQLEPTKGSVEHGQSLEIAYFDQHRHQLKEDLSLIENVAEGSDYLDINGQKTHVIGYLQQFLFDPKRMQSPASSLSGGERNRLLLAKLLAKPSNILVLDEPTNDLDIEALEVLEELLLNYLGTILIVSHDRAFINNIATSTLVFEQNHVNEYIGGYDDWLTQRKDPELVASNKIAKPPISTRPKKTKKENLNYTQKQELKRLPEIIEKLESQVSSLQQQMSDAKFYQNDPNTIKQTQQQLDNLNNKLAQSYQRWEELEELQEGYSGR